MKRFGRARQPDTIREAEREIRSARRQLRRRERRESRRFSVAARRRRRVWLIAGSAVLGLALFVAVGVFTPIMGVRDIEIVGTSKVNVADVETQLSRFDGTPLALVSDGEVATALESFPLIERYSVERVPPHTLRVNIVERVPVISVKRGKKFAQYDPAGVLVGSSKKRVKGVPLAKGAVAQTESQAFAAAAAILRDMPEKLRNRVRGVSATSAENVTFTMKGGLEVIWGGVEDIQRKSMVLEAMLRALKKQQVELIDVSSSEAPIFQ